MRFVILVLAVLFGLGCRGVDLPQSQQRVVRIMSYNIRHGQGMDGEVDLRRIANVISKMNPDLVALQEVDKNCERSGNTDIAMELGQILGMEYRFAKFMDFHGGEYGMAVLSRFPIVKTIRHPLPAGAEPRCALEVQVGAGGLSAPLSFVCIHNDWVSEEVRVEQISALISALQSNDNPIILAGDFNGQKTDSSMKVLEKNKWKILDKNGEKTWPSDKPEIEIDFIAVNRLAEASIEHGVVEEKMASDHRPIHAIITFQDKNKNAEPANPR